MPVFPLLMAAGGVALERVIVNTPKPSDPKLITLEHFDESRTANAFVVRH